MEKSIIVQAKEDVNFQLANKETMDSLLKTTFKGFAPEIMKRAILEATLRGFKFEDFLKNNVYAIPYNQGQTYSLVTSIDYARKLGTRSGIVGKSAPKFEEKNDKIISCTITVKRKVDDYIGEYSETVFFNEYNTGRNLWVKKPRTMIAKVAEMHALRMACPEELSKAYVEEEYQKETKDKEFDVIPYAEKLEAVKSMDELKKVWSDLPAKAKGDGMMGELKEKLKKKFDKVVKVVDKKDNVKEKNEDK